MQLSRIGIMFRHASFEFESHQAFCGGGEEEWADRRRRAEVEQSFHDAWRIARCLTDVWNMELRRNCAKKPPAFTGGLPRGGTATSAAVDPASTPGWCSSKQAVPDCSSGG